MTKELESSAPIERGAADVADPEIVDMAFTLLNRRAADATVCPSDVARRLVSDTAGWRALMPKVRAVAQRLAAEGRLRVTRRGVEVDATSPGGPIRLGRPAGGRAA